MTANVLRLTGLLALAAVLAVGVLFARDPGGPAEAQAVGGPVVLMGIDAEDGGVDGHGPIGVYEDVVSSMLAEVGNGGSGVLVIGGDKDGSDNVTEFWDQIGSDLSLTITYVNSGASITAQSFDGFALLAVVSSEGETSDGGLTQDENDALAGRIGDITTFVNSGGGLLGFSQAELTNPYDYIGGIGSFSVEIDLQYELITPTAEGSAIGITDDLDLCCWHDVYLTFPSFLGVLATQDDSEEDFFGEAAAIGGAQVIILPEGPFGDPTCADEIDNDDDGLIDGEDPDCAAPATATPTPAPTPEPTAAPTATPTAVAEVVELPDTGGSPGGGASDALAWLAAAIGAAAVTASGWWLANRVTRSR